MTIEIGLENKRDFLNNKGLPINIAGYFEKKEHMLKFKCLKVHSIILKYI